VVEGARLESVYTGNRIAGSNPALSANSHFEGFSAQGRRFKTALFGSILANSSVPLRGALVGISRSPREGFSEALYFGPEVRNFFDLETRI
jgi:hypothetical protein